ncbi:outer membrane protein assembly factor BamB [Chitiniphilus purpureus]|uniref:Outer membrane protein assembly factor BamB n=1 Tax=Chitiniphilus purpureus TaxID=2981137 RepID=A0ABY6DIS8_9NEIS|nr:outer membrane protein assembly factor BamB [Chitiniphilus sp. CD1]UXY14251.1 outer membrane protein assembly factor BamB [Chitiniphilus sp. CD1]
MPLLTMGRLTPVLRGAALAMLAGVLVACGSTSNQPEPSPRPQVADQIGARVLWRASAGGKTDFRFLPAQAGDRLIVAGAPAQLAALDLATGAQRWQVELEQPIAGGVGAGEGTIAVGSLKGRVYAYSYDGAPLWQIQVSSEVIAPPLVGGSIVVVRTADGRITGFSAADGARKWQFQRQMPALVLRNFAPMVVNDGTVFVGMAGGRMVALRLADGSVLWDSPVAQPRGATELERIADVVAPPVLGEGLVCAVAYQGRVGCLDQRNGTPVWSREASSYAGVALDSDQLYLVDDLGHVSALDRNSGRSMWRQDKLAARRVGAPARIGEVLAVGDLEGYVHFLSREDGRFVGQLSTDGSRVAAVPQVIGERLIVQTQAGNVFAIGIGQ